MKRPAENAAGGLSAAAAVSILTGAPEPVSIALVAAAGVLPRVISFVVDHGGIRGVALLAWRGRP
ncbi:MAG: hypothetical protein PGN13_16005 [Patulibacter minatonensis]